MSLRLYTGEYLISPVALHFGLNWCAHNCFYCFANLNQPHRRADNGDLLRIAKWFRDDKGPLEYWYLKHGHPLLVSNDSDPCSKSNAATFHALDDLAQSCGFRLTWQTKGGDPESEARILAAPPSMVYVSLTSDDDDFLRRAEPNAPGWQHRLDFMRRCVERGHFVVAGFNPLVPDWWHDLPAALNAVRAVGVRHVWWGRLHLSRFQIAAMPAAALERFGAHVDAARKHTEDPRIFEALDHAHALGINTLANGMPDTPGFWDAYFALGFPFFPTLDQCYKQLSAIGGNLPVAFDFDWFDRWARVDAPSGLSVYKEYLSRFGRSIRNEGFDTRARSFGDVHAWYWQIDKYPTPLRTPYVATAICHSQQEIPDLLVDSKQRPLLVFVPDGTEESHLDVETINAKYVYEGA